MSDILAIGLASLFARVVHRRLKRAALTLALRHLGIEKSRCFRPDARRIMPTNRRAAVAAAFLPGRIPFVRHQSLPRIDTGSSTPRADPVKLADYDARGSYVTTGL
ncbi:hypothetical protein JJB99_01855 [Bradyrhizobium diazoefficiens]|uniref:hypothetical protein n=1 Tax=Bradyrhizobium diazoefficiens TaxID=1355477 RepID=UPI00190D4F3A|nr:hypothetical protein [Bradyrhizobium diazoefficiens]QQO14961.1 hypothetical protein JJB99_01855 [Bradyrhizobium diazoefficiens]